MIDTADKVKHLITGQEMFVACVVGNKLTWIGSPEGSVNLSDCELIKSASEHYRLELLSALANGDKNDHRQQYAEKRLKEMRECSPNAVLSGKPR